MAVGYWNARNRPSRERLSGRQLQQVAALPQDLAALDHVRRVAHQRVGERRLARAVRAHDRVDLALGDRQVDALEDVVVGLGDGCHNEVADHEVVVVRRLLVGHDEVRAPWGASGTVAGIARSGARSARVIDSRVDVMASRTRTHSRFTVQRRGAVADEGVLGIVRGAEHRGDRPLERAQDLAHGDGLGGSGELVAAMGAAGANDEPGFAQVHDELLEIRARQVLLGGDAGQAGRAGPVVPGELDHQAHAVLALGRERDGAGAVVRGPKDGGDGLGQGSVLDIRVISSGLSLRPAAGSVNAPRGR